MAEIVATFDTKSKALSVTKDGKKLKDVSGVEFYAYGEQGGVEIRSVNMNEEESFVTITKIMANEQGEDVITTEKCESGDMNGKDKDKEKDKEKDKKKQTADLARALFPNKDIDGV